MSDAKIIYAKTIGSSQAWPLVVRGMAELMEAGYSDDRGGFSVGWDYQVVYAVKAGTAVACIAYVKQDWANQYYIGLSWTEPSMRGFGLHTALWSDLVKRATADGVARILGSIHVNNEPMLMTAHHFKRRPVATIFAYDVATAPE